LRSNRQFLPARAKKRLHSIKSGAEDIWTKVQISVYGKVRREVRLASEPSVREEKQQWARECHLPVHLRRREEGTAN